MIDLHSHILPGLDDGSRNLDESLAMAKCAVADGITTMAATPHLFRKSVGDSDPDTARKKFGELKSLLAGERVSLDLHLGAEVHIMHNLPAFIREHGRRLAVNEGRYVLLEFPADHVFPGVRELFFDLMSEGFVPIIAHPERNSFFMHHPGLLYQLVQAGALCQLNGGSLTGLYGNRVRETAFLFLENNLLHLMGSDCHNLGSRRPELSGAVAEVAVRKGNRFAAAMVGESARAVLENRDVPRPHEALDPEAQRRSARFRLPLFFKRG